MGACSSQVPRGIDLFAKRKSEALNSSKLLMQSTSSKIKASLELHGFFDRKLFRVMAAKTSFGEPRVTRYHPNPTTLFCAEKKNIP